MHGYVVPMGGMCLEGGKGERRSRVGRREEHVHMRAHGGEAVDDVREQEEVGGWRCNSRSGSPQNILGESVSE